MNETLSERLTRMGLERGLSKTDVANALGLSRATIIKWENGDTKNLKHENLLGLAKYYGISVNELITGVPEIAQERPATTEHKAAEPGPREHYAPLSRLVRRIADDLMRLPIERQMEVKHWAAVEVTLLELRKPQADTKPHATGTEGLNYAHRS